MVLCKGFFMDKKLVVVLGLLLVLALLLFFSSSVSRPSDEDIYEAKNRFESKTLGFSVMKPDFWSVEENHSLSYNKSNIDYVLFTSQNGFMAIMVSCGETISTPRAEAYWQMHLLNQSDLYPEVLSEQARSVGSYNAYEFVAETWSEDNWLTQKFVVAQHAGRACGFTLISPSPEFENADAVLEEMLSTLEIKN